MWTPTIGSIWGWKSREFKGVFYLLQQKASKKQTHKCSQTHIFKCKNKIHTFTQLQRHLNPMHWALAVVLILIRTLVLPLKNSAQPVTWHSYLNLGENINICVINICTCMIMQSNTQHNFLLVRAENTVSTLLKSVCWQLFSKLLQLMRPLKRTCF